MALDRIALNVVEEPFPNGTPAESVQVLINGVDLWDLVAAAERAVNAHGGDSPVGEYRGLWPEAVFLPSRRFLGEPVETEAPWDEDGLITLMGCDSCGFMDCWPLAVRIVVGPRTVRWQGFRHPRQISGRATEPWSHFKIEPFEFGRLQYEEELAKEWKRDPYPRLRRAHSSVDAGEPAGSSLQAPTGAQKPL